MRIFLLLFFLASTAFAKTVAWDANPATDAIIRYRIYITQERGVYQFGGTTSPNFLASVPVTQTSFILPTLAAVPTWAVVTAYNATGESPASNEIQIVEALRAPANFRLVP